MTRRLNYEIPGPDRRITPGEVADKGLAALFAPDVTSPLDLVVEIGFGGGEFLLDLAEAAPRTAHLGVEVSSKRVLKLARRLATLPLTNVRLLRAAGEEVAEDLLGSEQVAACWINFPDPWPKKRHLRRRLLQPPLVAILADRLVNGGSLHVATDHVDYAAQIDAVLAAEPTLSNAFAPDRFVREVPGRLHTIYEREWRAEGRPLHFWQYLRRPRRA